MVEYIYIHIYVYIYVYIFLNLALMHTKGNVISDLHSSICFWVFFSGPRH